MQLYFFVVILIELASPTRQTIIVFNTSFFPSIKLNLNHLGSNTYVNCLLFLPVWPVSKINWHDKPKLDHPSVKVIRSIVFLSYVVFYTFLVKTCILYCLEYEKERDLEVVSSVKVFLNLVYETTQFELRFVFIIYCIKDLKLEG